MALLEINLRKPALMEEVVDESARDSGEAGHVAGTSERGQGGGSMMGKLGMVGAVVVAVAVARAIRSRRSSSEPEGVKVPIESGSSESSGGGQGRRIAGIVLAVLGAVAVARRMQGGSRK